MSELRIGAAFRAETPPELISSYAKKVEELGFDELWTIEDCFLTGGISTTAVALAATERLSVGIGILPAVARNPAMTAMEFAGLARMFPGRVLPGLGHGVGAWMKQIGAFPESQLATLEEITTAVKRLLAGENVAFHGRHVSLEGVQLDLPPEVVPPVVLGVSRAKSLALSGRVADGTLLCEPSSPAYVRWAREQIAASDDHRVTVYAWFGTSPEGQVAVREQLAQRLVHGGEGVFLEPLGLVDEVAELVARYPDPKDLAECMPDSWLRSLTASGTPEESAEFLAGLAEAGADSVVLMPPADPNLAVRELELAAAEVVPLIGDGR